MYLSEIIALSVKIRVFPRSTNRSSLQTLPFSAPEPAFSPLLPLPMRRPRSGGWSLLDMERCPEWAGGGNPLFPDRAAFRRHGLAKDYLLRARPPVRRRWAHEDRIDERPVVAVPTARLRGRGRHHHDLWLSGGPLAPSPIILSCQPPIAVTEDDQRPSGLQATVDPFCPERHLCRARTTRRFEPWRGVLGRAAFLFFVAEAAGLEGEAQHIDAGGADVQLDGGPVPELPDVQGGDSGLPFGLDAPAERPSSF